MNLVPDRFVNAKGVARRRRKQVHQQQMNPSSHEVDGLVNKVPYRGPTVLISRRQNLDDGNNPTEVMTHDDAIGATGINLL